MKELYQKMVDLYICGPREFHRNYIQNFWKRLIITFDKEKEIFERKELPLGYSTLDDKLKEATRRQFDLASKRYA